ncbi:unnamed protein product [Urochloa decumbens]|uniref:Uncharacterized protein n=1 Tax=Urochloa decumbens TaxID=240449 RepID=A0ABC9BUS3_9POAL
MAAHNNSSTDAAAARDGDGEPTLLRSGARTAMTLIDNTTAGLHYLDYDMHAVAKNDRGAAAAKGNVHFFELPRRGVARYDSGVDAGEALALPLAPQVFGGKMTSVLPAAAVDVGQDNVVGAFTERLRPGLPVLGISVASLAVAGLAAGELDPAAGFGLFLMLIVGLSAVTISVIRA